jgi:hypothetical protein
VLFRGCVRAPTIPRTPALGSAGASARLDAHGLIAKIPRTRRWRVTDYGHNVIGTMMYLREHHFQNVDVGELLRQRQESPSERIYPPDAVGRRLNKDVAAVLPENQLVCVSVEARGSRAVSSTPEQFADHGRGETAKWPGVVARLRLRYGVSRS